MTVTSSDSSISRQLYKYSHQTGLKSGFLSKNLYGGSKRGMEESFQKDRKNVNIDLKFEVIYVFRRESTGGCWYEMKSTENITFFGFWWKPSCIPLLFPTSALSSEASKLTIKGQNLCAFAAGSELTLLCYCLVG